MNILFLGGAKRVSIAREFKSYPNVNIFSYELSKDVPISIEADEIIVGKRWNDSELDSDLRKIISEYKIDIVIPFVDGAVAPAARLSDVVFTPTSNETQSKLMFDKVECDKYLRNLNIAVPNGYSQYCKKHIAKPRYGSASKGLIVFDDDSDIINDDNYLIQEFIENRREITIDCYIEPSTRKICALVSRERLEVSGGEVTRTRTFYEKDVTDFAKIVLEKTHLTGAVTIQLIHDLDNDRLMLMEINPRLGGGVVCSIAAGVNIPFMIINNALGRNATVVDNYKNVEMARYHSEVYFYNE